MRPIANDVLAARARERREAAKPDSRERRAWQVVTSALDATTTTENARAFIHGLAIPTLRDDAVRMLGELTAESE